jgi:hypothetical protein
MEAAERSASHFALWQQPDAFAATVLESLAGNERQAQCSRYR